MKRIQSHEFCGSFSDEKPVGVFVADCYLRFWSRACYSCKLFFSFCCKTFREWYFI